MRLYKNPKPKSSMPLPLGSDSLVELKSVNLQCYVWRNTLKTTLSSLNIVDRKWLRIIVKHQCGLVEINCRHDKLQRNWFKEKHHGDKRVHKQCHQELRSTRLTAIHYRKYKRWFHYVELNKKTDHTTQVMNLNGKVIFFIDISDYDSLNTDFSPCNIFTVQLYNKK